MLHILTDLNQMEKIKLDIEIYDFKDLHLMFMKARRDLGMKQSTLAGRCRLSTSTISRFEAGHEVSISIKKYFRIAKELGFDFKLARVK